MRKLLRLLAASTVLVALCAALPVYATQSDQGLSAIDQIIANGIRDKKIPGAVVIVGHHGKIIFHQAYGMRSLEPAQERMTENTIFDMASLTKPLATATAIMQLYQQGRFRLDDPVSQYLPQFAANGKESITIRQLLTHYSGLPPDLNLADVWEGKEEAYRRAYATTLQSAPGAQFRYSDINFIVLGALVEKLSGISLDEYEQRYIAGPLGMRHTRFLPPESWQPLIAPTQYDQNHVMLRGLVHDPTSRRMGGVAGHAGLFSTADDVAIYAQNLLDRLAGKPSRFPLRRLTLEKMIVPGQPATGTALRGLGWDIESPYSSNRGELFPVGSFGHTGFTGTSLWIDPVSGTYVIVLTNAVHPNGPTGISSIRADVANAAAQTVGVTSDTGTWITRLTGYNESLAGMRRWPARNGQVENGIDVLEQDHFAELTDLTRRHGGKLRVGLLTNQTGVDASGRRTIDVLAKDAEAAVPGFQLTTLFSPEHGIKGAADTTNITNSTDAAAGLPVVSLYGATDAERRPSLQTLQSLDAVVVDLQDVGVRFYTYETAVRYFLEAAAKTHTELIILDRPNPLGGSFVQGPLSDSGRSSYVDVANIPVRHGFTLGELAQYLNGELGLHAPLTVIRLKGWERGDWFDSTGQTWVNPSPNLRSLQETMLYPALGLIETTNISVGRGTETPFQQVGAPWIDGRQLAQYLNKRSLPGVRFVPVTFTPQSPYPYAGTLCNGVNILITNRNVIDMPALGLEIAAALHKLYGSQYQLEKIDTLLANATVLHALTEGEDPEKIEADWQSSLQHFESARKPYLLY